MDTDTNAEIIMWKGKYKRLLRAVRGLHHDLEDGVVPPERADHVLREILNDRGDDL